MFAHKIDEIEAMDRIRIDEFSFAGIFGCFRVLWVVGAGVSGPVE
jgi:hypothetical protein